MVLQCDIFFFLAKLYKESSELTNQEKASARMHDADQLVKECRRVYDKINEEKTLRIRVGSNGNDKPESNSGGNGADADCQEINLRGVKCPFNYVKTKLKMEILIAKSARMENIH